MSSRIALEQKIKANLKEISMWERDIRELNNKLPKPHQGVWFACDLCDNEASYLEDEIVKRNGKPICYDCFDKEINNV